MMYSKKIALFLTAFLFFAPQLSANPVKHLMVENKGFTNMVAQHHMIEINFNGRVVWTTLPAYNQSFREVLGQADSGYQRVVDSGIQNTFTPYKAGSIVVRIHNNTPPKTKESIVATCRNLKPIQGAFRNVVIKIDLKRNCVVEEYNVDLP